MKDGMKYRFLACVVFVFFAAISLSFGFLIGKASTEGNVAYWVFKGICVGWLVILAIGVLLSKGGFSRYFPLALSGLVAQIFPLFLRIGWKVNHQPSIAAIYICAILLFLLVVINLFYAFAHQRFTKDENRAKPSSKLQ